MNDSDIISYISDYSDILSALQICSPYFYNQIINNDTSLKILAEKFFMNGNVLTASFNNNLVGFCAYYANDNKNHVAFLSMIILLPIARGKGVSTRLLETMISDCKKRGMFSIELEVDDTNERALGFYRKHGFVKKMHKSNNSSIYCLEIKEK